MERSRSYRRKGRGGVARRSACARRSAAGPVPAMMMGSGGLTRPTIMILLRGLLVGRAGLVCQERRSDVIGGYVKIAKGTRQSVGLKIRMFVYASGLKKESMLHGDIEQGKD